MTPDDRAAVGMAVSCHPYRDRCIGYQSHRIIYRLASTEKGAVSSSVARLFLVPEGQNIHCIVGRLIAVQSHIAGISEGNHQLA